MATSAEVLCNYNPPEFCKFTEAVLEMKFDEYPKYAALIALFEPILAGCVHKPICVDSAIKVSFLFDIPQTALHLTGVTLRH